MTSRSKIPLASLPKAWNWTRPRGFTAMVEGPMVTVANGPRTLDLDLLLFGRTAIDEPGLVVPHPQMESRTFVLGPLAHIVPDLVLPGCGVTVSRRLAELEDLEVGG